MIRLSRVPLRSPGSGRYRNQRRVRLILIRTGLAGAVPANGAAENPTGRGGILPFRMAKRFRAHTAETPPPKKK
jgi:hypothetical protein